MTELQQLPSQAPTARNISNSELVAWLQCERKYYYNYDLALEPKSFGATLARGIAGHMVLEAYYSALMETDNNFEYAQSAGDAKLNELMQQGEFDLEVLIDLRRLFIRYWPISQRIDSNWKVLAVEREYSIQLTSVFNYSMKLDLLVRDLTTGKLIIVDHKFVYDFYKQAVIDMNPQMPKYIATLKAGGLSVDYGLLNMIRWRVKKGPMEDSEIFQRNSIIPSTEKLMNIMREQMKGSLQIINHRELTMPERSDAVLRSMNKLNCQNCSYNPLCMAELNGHDITVDIELNYQRAGKLTNYGYNNEGLE